MLTHWLILAHNFWYHTIWEGNLSCFSLLFIWFLPNQDTKMWWTGASFLRGSISQGDTLASPCMMLQVMILTTVQE